MEVYEDVMFRIPLYKVKIEPWQEVKQKILGCISGSKYHIDPKGNNFSTDFSDQFDPFGFFIEEQRHYSQNVYEILNPWIAKISTNVFGREIPESSPNMWTQKYCNNSEHPIHNHGNRGYSFILYLEYDSEVHLPTKFYSPFGNFFHGNILEFCPNVVEGTLICFPSVINHTSQRQKTDKERMILSFNMFSNG